MAIPSESLADLELKNGWKVIEKIHKHEGATGGRFSCGYKVQKEDRVAYLKALDFSEALQCQDTNVSVRKLEQLTAAYNFECDILQKCKGRNLTKIVTAIEVGSIDVPAFPEIIGRVYYIIFDFADGDVRKIKDTFKKIDLAFTFRALHNAAVGLKQLHGNEIAHQDLKPSNILVFEKDYKISDLGRASDKSTKFFYDDMPIPGDRNYAPLEQQYRYRPHKDFNDKYAADMYLFGSLFFFFFTGLSAAQALHKKAMSMKITCTNSFETDIAEWERVFSEVLFDFKNMLQNTLSRKEDVEEVKDLIKYLCHPNPHKRGYPRPMGAIGPQYSLEKFISRFDYFAKKAELELL